MNPEREYRDITTRAYRLRPDSIDVEGRSVEAVIATEVPCRVFDWSTWEEVDEVLLMDGMRGGGQVVLLDTHKRGSVFHVLGSTRDIRVEECRLCPDKEEEEEDRALVGRNVYSDDEDAEKIWKKVRGGHVTDNSIGYRVRAFTTVKAGETASVNGRTFAASEARDLRVTTEWELVENSCCPIGADALAKNRDESAAVPPPARPETEEGMSVEERADSATPVEQEKERTPDNIIDIEAVKRQAITEDLERRKAIQDAAAGIPGITEGFLRGLLDSPTMTVDTARAAILDKMREAGSESVGSPAIHSRSHETTCTREALEAALGMRMGFTPEVEQLAEAGDEFRNLSIKEMARECVRIDGQRVPRSDVELVRTALSTYSLPTIFSNVANKALMRSFAEAPGTALRWVDTEEVADFKTQTRVRDGASSELNAVDNGGEIEHETIEEWAETYEVKPYAKKLVMTYQDVINDDLGVMMRRVQRLGAAAMRKIDDLVYRVLIANANLNDGIALFNAAGHGNLQTGAASALSDPSLQIGEAAMGTQTDLDGTTSLNIMARYLIVPRALRHTAVRLVSSENIVVSGGGATQTIQGDANPWRNQFEVITEARLSNLAGGSATAWYLAADPTQAPTIVVGFLRGQRTPMLARLTLEDPLAMGWYVMFALGAKALDFRGLYKSNGV